MTVVQHGMELNDVISPMIRGKRYIQCVQLSSQIISVMHSGIHTMEKFDFLSCTSSNFFEEKCMNSNLYKFTFLLIRFDAIFR